MHALRFKEYDILREIRDILLNIVGTLWIKFIYIFNDYNLMN